MDELRREITLLWPDLETLSSAGSVRFVTQPADDDGESIFRKLIPQPADSSALIGKLIPAARPRLTVGFVHYGTIYTSGWTYAHD